MPNYIRVKQINQGELTGFFVDSISSQSGLLLAFASGAANNAASGIILNETVLLTGNQNISGNKTFLNNLNVSGDLTIAGTLRYNEIIDTTVTGSISGYTGIFSQVYANNLVYNTGDQTISGNKTFATQIIAPNLIYNTGNQTISGDKTFEDNVNISGDLTLNGGLYINDVEELNLAGAKIYADNLVYNTGDQTISGDKTFSNNLNVSGDLTVAGTLRYNEIIDTTVTGNISGYTGIFTQVFADNLVYNTGNQNISGDKTFEDNINISGDLTLNGGLYINDIEELNLAGAKIYADNLVYNTGNQTISGVKTFAGALYISGSEDSSENLIQGFGNIKIRGSNNNYHLYLTDEAVYIAGNTEINDSLYVGKNFTVEKTGIFLDDVYITGGSSKKLNINTNFELQIDDLQLSGTDVTLTSGNVNIDGNLIVQKSGFFWSGIKIGLNSIIIDEESIRISGDPVIVQSTFTGYTGDVVNTYATISNLDALSGSAVLLYGDQTINGIKAFSNYIQFNNNGSIYSTSVVGNESGITLTTFQQPTDIVRRNNFVGGNSDEVISIGNTNTSNIFGQSINGIYDSIVIYNTGSTYGTLSSKGPYLRLGDNNIISEKSTSKLGIGTLFPSEKVHISGGNLKVEGDTIANNLVYNTGNQTISGTKNFQNTIQFSGQDILVAPADYIYITGNQTSIINGTKYLADTTSASFGFNLPASPTTGDYLEFLDPFYTWSGNNFILSGNGNNIESDAVFTGDIEGASIRTIYVGKTYGWRVKYNI